MAESDQVEKLQFNQLSELDGKTKLKQIMLKSYGFKECIFLDWGSYFGRTATLDVSNIKDIIKSGFLKQK